MFLVFLIFFPAVVPNWSILYTTHCLQTNFCSLRNFRSAETLLVRNLAMRCQWF